MSIIEVAKVAGVSHMTVSRFVNKSAKVNAETSQRIQEAMDKLGYVPRPPHLRPGPPNHLTHDFTTKNLAFLTVSRPLRILSVSPFLIDLVHGIEEASSGYGLSLFQAVLHPDRPLPPFISRGEVDGLIIYSGLEGFPQNYIEVLKRYPIVFVLTGRDTFFLGDRIMCNHEHIGKMAAGYLISRGHRHVVYFDLNSSLHYQQELFSGRWTYFAQVCRQADVSSQRIVIPLTSEETLFDRPKATRVLKDVVAKTFRHDANGDCPTGAFAVFDSLTAVMYPALQSCGTHVGKDIDIISCNNEVSLLAGLHPRPATIDLQPALIGRRAMERLRYRIQNPNDESRITLEILPKLIEGSPAQ
jgi:DNA-binding LacI/PurR family transcriptional regulator